MVSRGLREDPRARWADLGALLEAIEGRLRWRRRGALVVVVGAVAVGLASYAQSRGEAPSCTRGAPAAWAPDQREAFLDAANASDAPQREANAATAAELERHATSWMTTQDQLCARRETQSLELETFGARRDCLDRLHQRTQSALDRIALEPLDHALHQRLLAALPSPVACSTLAPSAAGSPTPSGPGEFTELADHAQLRVGFGGAVHARDAGDFAEAERRAAALVAFIEADPTRRGSRDSALSEALLHLGEAQHQLGKVEPARRSLERAAVLAELGRDPRHQFLALRALAELELYAGARPHAAQLALSLAAAPLESLGRPAELRAKADSTAALIADAEGEHSTALALLRGVLDAQLALHSSPFAVTNTRMRIANALARAGQPERALEAYAQLRAERSSTLGSNHPALASLDFNAGLTWVELGEWERALPALRRALSGHEHSHGSQSKHVADVLVTLAEVELELGQLSPAVRHAERAVAIQSARLPMDHPDRSAGLAALAWAHLQAGDFEAALRDNLALRDTLDPSWEDERAAMALNIAWLECRLGRCPEAWDDIELGLRSEDATVRAKARALEVEFHLDTRAPGHAAEALTKLEAQFPKLPVEERDATFLAEFAWLRLRVARAEGAAASVIVLLQAEVLVLSAALTPDQRAEL